MRISLIHATQLAIDPVRAAFRKSWPEVETVSLLDDALSIDRAKDEALSPALHDRIVTLGRYAESIGSAGILYTCSAFGAAIETVARVSSIPVLKPNEAMFEQAFSYGNRIAMIYTFPPAVTGMEQEFREEAARRGASVALRPVFADGARAALEAGDVEAHNRTIADTAERQHDADVILLAHFSMAPAAQVARQATRVPILTSPETAVTKLKGLLEQDRG